MIWIVLIAFACIAAAPFILERRKPDMNRAVRNAATEGSFAKLSDGHTYYRWHGPKGGKPMVCIHGLTTPSYVWDDLLPGLTACGYRVLTYDLYGRGLSDRPNGTQTRSFFMRQLRDLLQDQGVNGPITVMGYSMGGSIATVFAAEEPDRVRQLILLAPAGIEHRPTKFSEAVRTSGRTGEWIMLAFAGRTLRRGAQDTPWSAEMAARVAAETSRRGYLNAVLSSMRNMLAETLEEEHRALKKSGVPLIAIWGEQDDVIPAECMGQLAQWNQDAKQSMISAAGHALPVTHTQKVLSELKRLLGL